MNINFTIVDKEIWYRNILIMDGFTSHIQAVNYVWDNRNSLEKIVLEKIQ